MITKGVSIFSNDLPSSLLPVVLFLGGYVLILCAEWRRHYLNLRFLLFAGATQHSKGVMRLYYLIVLGFLPFAVFEGQARWTAEVEPVQVLGLVLIACGVGLRHWALSTLGAAWTMSCIYWPQMPRIRRGPFRWIGHPEYLSRIMDCTGLCLVLNALVTASLVVPMLSLITWLVLRVERPVLSLMREELEDSEPLGDAGFVP